MDLQAKTERHLLVRSILETRALPPPIAVPLLEAASIETNEELHNLWGALLAEAMDSKRPPLDRRLVFAMKALTPECVPVLEIIWQELLSAQRKLSKPDRGVADLNDAVVWAVVHPFSFQEAGIEQEFVEYLVGVGLLEHPTQERKARGFTDRGNHVVVDVEGKDFDYDLVRCTALGLQFLEAVMVQA